MQLVKTVSGTTGMATGSLGWLNIAGGYHKVVIKRWRPLRCDLLYFCLSCFDCIRDNVITTYRLVIIRRCNSWILHHCGEVHPPHLHMHRLHIDWPAVDQVSDSAYPKTGHCIHIMYDDHPCAWLSLNYASENLLRRRKSPDYHPVLVDITIAK